MAKGRAAPFADVFPVTTEILSHEEFLKRLPHIKENIAATTLVAAILGRPGFGGIQVVYRRPIYRHLSNPMRVS
jgi:hypothetical protein